MFASGSASMKTYPIQTLEGTGYVAVVGSECSPVYPFPCLASWWGRMREWGLI